MTATACNIVTVTIVPAPVFPNPVKVCDVNQKRLTLMTFSPSGTAIQLFTSNDLLNEHIFYWPFGSPFVVLNLRDYGPILLGQIWGSWGVSNGSPITVTEVFSP